MTIWSKWLNWRSGFVAGSSGDELTMLLSGMVEKAGFKEYGDRISSTLFPGIGRLLAGDSRVTFFEHADKALYQAKQNGRNQCSVI